MRRIEMEKAAQSAIASMVGGPESKSARNSGLGSKNTGKRFARFEIRIARLRDDCADGSERRLSWANMALPLRSKRCRGGSLLSDRRMTAAPALTRDVAFLFGGIRTHGLIAPALYRFCGLMPCGKPLGLPSPVARLLPHPHGVALPVEGESGFRQFATGACHE